MQIFNLKKENLKYFLFPIFIFLGTFFVEPFYKIEAVSPTIPYFQWFYVILSVPFYYSNIKKYNGNFIITFLMLVILIYAILIAETTFLSKISYIGVVFFAKIVSNIKNGNNYYDKIYHFVLSYSILSISIYIFRLFKYNFDFSRVRGSMNIWGGNPLIMTIYLLIVIQILFKRPKDEVFIFSLLALVVSFLFVDRIPIVTSIIIVFIQLFERFKKKPVKISFFLFFFWILFFKNFIKSDFFSFVSQRFATFSSKDLNNINNLVKNTSPTRLYLRKIAVNILDQNIMGIGVGRFHEFSIYSSPHNLLLNNLIESGLIFGGIINFILFLPIVKLIKLNISHREKYLAIFIYSSFLLNATFSGAKLIQLSGYTSAFLLLFIFCVFNSISYRKNNNL